MYLGDGLVDATLDGCIRVTPIFHQNGGDQLRSHVVLALLLQQVLDKKVPIVLRGVHYVSV